MSSPSSPLVTTLLKNIKTIKINQDRPTSSQKITNKQRTPAVFSLPPWINKWPNITCRRWRLVPNANLRPIFPFISLRVCPVTRRPQLTPHIGLILTVCLHYLLVLSYSDVSRLSLHNVSLTNLNILLLVLLHHLSWLTFSIDQWFRLIQQYSNKH